MSSVCVGIDWSDLRPRVAFLAHGQLRYLEVPIEFEGLSAVFDPGANISSLGVSFPPVLQAALAKPHQRQSGDGSGLGSLIVRFLAELRASVVKTTGESSPTVAFAVPSSLTERKRDTLVTFATEGGFERIELIDACSAVALAQGDDASASRTWLVYRLGYGDCELSLLRSARGRTRVVGTSVVPRASGEIFDALVIEAIVLALRESRIFLGLREFTAAKWLELRSVARAARILLGRQRQVAGPLTHRLTGHDGIRLEFGLEGLAVILAPIIERTLADLSRLLERHEIGMDHIDAAFVAGDDAQAPPVSYMLAHALGGKSALVDPRSVVRGALAHACSVDGQRLPGLPTLALRSIERPDGDSERWSAARLASLEEGPELVVVKREPAFSPVSGDEARRPELMGLRKMIEEGRVDEAAAEIDALGSEIDALRKLVHARENSSDVRVWLEQAEQLIETGSEIEAVDLSHRAFNAAKDDPVVFAGMMRIHCEAARRMKEPERYERAIQLLECAHAHDPTDRDVWRTMAERHFAHALELRERGSVSKSLHAADLALKFDPGHANALALRKALTSGDGS